MDPDERERRALALLLHWPEKPSGVLVGGYAVAAYGPPRYSEDLDIAVAKDGITEWERWLSEAGLRRERWHPLPHGVDGALEVGRWRSGDLLVDLMAGGVRDRDSGAVIPEAWLLRSPNSARLELISGRLERPVPVARVEAMWAMKLMSGRPQDLTDLYSMAGRPFDPGSVRELLTSLSNPPLAGKFERIARTIRDRKLYADSLSRLRLGRPNTERNLASWGRFVKTVARSLPIA